MQNPNLPLIEVFGLLFLIEYDMETDV